MKNKSNLNASKFLVSNIVCPACKNEINFKEVVEKNGSIGCLHCSS